jgi:hypothetical protein
MKEAEQKCLNEMLLLHWHCTDYLCRHVVLYRIIFKCKWKIDTIMTHDDTSRLTQNILIFHFHHNQTWSIKWHTKDTTPEHPLALRQYHSISWFVIQSTTFIFPHFTTFSVCHSEFWDSSDWNLSVIIKLSTVYLFTKLFSQKVVEAVKNYWNQIQIEGNQNW